MTSATLRVMDSRLQAELCEGAGSNQHALYGPRAHRLQPVSAQAVVVARQRCKPGHDALEDGSEMRVCNSVQRRRTLAAR